MAAKLEVLEIGDVYELRRGQWGDNIVRISKDPALLEEVKKYTWTYCKGNHPYIKCSREKKTLHEFVMGFVYGKDNIDKLQAEGNIIEHLDNNGLNCTYENLHIISDDLNKAKAFSIDKMNKEGEKIAFPPYVVDVYYLHKIKQFQMQIFLNENIYFNNITKKPVEMFICRYNVFEDIFPDWFYLLNSRESIFFDIGKLNAYKVAVKDSPVIELLPEEQNMPYIYRNGVKYLILDAKKNGVPLVALTHTSLRKIDFENE